ncbi:hypothetical protein HanIR_Chr01g0042301 [Helianthus annuus]|nr:hypothetical protein HanIR_Chr01g0042301 [Helianthus annuus]
MLRMVYMGLAFRVMISSPARVLMNIVINICINPFDLCMSLMVDFLLMWKSNRVALSPRTILLKIKACSSKGTCSLRTLDLRFHLGNGVCGFDQQRTDEIAIGLQQTLFFYFWLLSRNSMFLSILYHWSKVVNLFLPYGNICFDPTNHKLTSIQ